MSRIGKQPITIPAGVTATLAAGVLTITGPLGTLTRSFDADIAITLTTDGKEITLLPAKDTVYSRALWGTYGSHIKNMVIGVTKGYEKKLSIEGVGYKVSVQGDKLVLDIGLSHSVMVPIPVGVKATAEKGNFAFSGIDKEAVGQFAARIRAFKPTEPYKGKGIRYEGEHVRRKQGKKTAG
jgi:large subunit ribosomal protein L6